MKVWARIGVSIDIPAILLGDKEYSEKLIIEKIMAKDFRIDGESYIPADGRLPEYLHDIEWNLKD